MEARVEADLKEGEISPHSFCFQRALHSGPKRGGEEGDRSTNTGGMGTMVGKIEKLDLYKNPHSSLVGHRAFTLRHQGTVSRRTVKIRWCGHLEMQPYPHELQRRSNAYWPSCYPSPTGLAVTAHFIEATALAHQVHTQQEGCPCWRVVTNAELCSP